MCDHDDYRLEVLISLRNLERLDKDEVTGEEKQGAQNTYNQRLLADDEEPDEQRKEGAKAEVVIH